ncbi:hypothetical protein EsH8_VII_000445 [Colletotrichum jinshuiense]
MLLEYGADVEMVPEDSYYGKGREVSHTPLLRAYQRSDRNMIKSLLDKGANLHTLTGNYDANDSFLEILCLMNRILDVKTILDWGLDISLGLPAACFKGHLELVQLLLDSGINPDVQNAKFGDPLGAASYGGHINIVQLLLKGGATVNASFSIYGGPLLAASIKGHNQVVQTLLDHRADPNGSFGSIQESLKQRFQAPGRQAGSWFSIARYGNALQAASQAGHEDTAQLLLTSGADVKIRGGEYGSAIVASTFKGHKGMIKLLLEAGANVDVLDGSWGHVLEEDWHKWHNDIVRDLIANHSVSYMKATTRRT